MLAKIILSVIAIALDHYGRYSVSPVVQIYRGSALLSSSKAAGGHIRGFKEGREHACWPACTAVERHQAFGRLSLVTATCRGILGRRTRGEHDADVRICAVSSFHWLYRYGARAEMCALSLLPTASRRGVDPLLWGAQ